MAKAQGMRSRTPGEHQKLKKYKPCRIANVKIAAIGLTKYYQPKTNRNKWWATAYCLAAGVDAFDRDVAG